jgi:hypothetical protein
VNNNQTMMCVFLCVFLFVIGRILRFVLITRGIQNRKLMESISKSFIVCAKYWRRKTLKKKGRRKQQQQHTHFVLSFIYIFFHISVFAFFGPIFFSFFGEVVDSTSFPLLPVLKKKIASQNKEEDKNWAQNEC